MNLSAYHHHRRRRRHRSSSPLYNPPQKLNHYRKNETRIYSAEGNIMRRDFDEENVTLGLCLEKDEKMSWHSLLV